MYSGSHLNFYLNQALINSIKQTFPAAIYTVAVIILPQFDRQQIEQTMLQWFKKSFQQFQDSTWYYQSKGDEKIYDSTVDHINQQMKQQKRDFLKKTIEKLGFRQEKDYDGKIVLKNNIPIKRSMTYRQVEDLITRLKVDPKPQKKTKTSPQQSNIKKQIQSYQKEN